MSSWFQYEALKFVSFPTQVLGKASKVIPVMIMGKVVSGNKYSFFEWFIAFLLSVGVSLFLFGTPQDTSKGADSTSFSGLILMMGYMLFDSFTSNWQGQLFKEYKMSSFQMMLGVNIFSTTFTLGSLLQQGKFFASIAFMLKYSEFMFHCVTLSICSAVGQLFIYYTMGQFGAVIFIIIMTTRQALAILLSCMIYGHPVTAIGF
jgi:adenosine 3'-phospho 5'-phosphosulfate transporter B2